MATSENAFSEKENLQKLTQAVREMAEGTHEAEIAVDLYGEMGELAKHLNIVSKKLQSSESVIDSASAQLPFGASQLSDVTRQTEEATQRILGYTEKVMGNHDLMTAQLETLKATLPPMQCVDELCSLVDKNKETMMDLLTALSFQDPAGQQLKKIAATLQEIQSRILKVIVSHGIRAKGKEMTKDRQETLLNELELSAKTERLDQNLVDKVLKEFGF